jgi:hypothetical protein
MPSCLILARGHVRRTEATEGRRDRWDLTDVDRLALP